MAVQFTYTLYPQKVKDAIAATKHNNQTNKINSASVYMLRNNNKITSKKLFCTSKSNHKQYNIPRIHAITNQQNTPHSNFNLFGYESLAKVATA
jgi:hypothetical protein